MVLCMNVVFHMFRCENCEDLMGVLERDIVRANKIRETRVNTEKSVEQEVKLYFFQCVCSFHAVTPLFQCIILFLYLFHREKIVGPRNLSAIRFTKAS